MRIVKPSYEIWNRNCDQLELIERAARVCYQTEPKGDAAGFIQRILERRPPHGSVLEHGWFAVTGYRPFPMPPFMEWSEEHQLLLGNARAWRNDIRRGKVGLPQGLKEVCPVLFSQVKQRPDPIAAVVDMPAGLVFTVNFIYDRGVSHEKVRHRPPSYSQESTRYCDYGDKGIAIVHPPEGELSRRQLDRREALFREIEAVYQAERAEGIAPQIARGVLPTCLKTQIVVTAYWTEWQIMFALRCMKQAHVQMREVMVPLQAELAAMYPEKFSEEVIQEVRENLD